MKSYWKKLKHYFEEVVKSKPTPEAIALGFAVGTFISVLPTPFINVFIGLLVIFIYEPINKYSLFGSILFWNPLTLAPIYWLSYKIGNVIFATAPVKTYQLNFLHQVYYLTRRFVVGSLILAVPVSILTYYLVKKIAEHYQSKPLK